MTRSSEWKEACSHLSADPVMKLIIRRAGACQLARRTDFFPFLCKAIFNQQLSGKIARLLYDRFAAHFPAKKPTPARTIARAPCCTRSTRRCASWRCAR